MRRIAVVGVAGLVAALAACNNSSSNNGSSTPSTSASGHATHASSHSPTAGGSLPSVATLRSALLTATDLGSNPTKEPSTNSGETDTGCTELDPIISNNYVRHTGQHEADVTYGVSGTTTTEVLVAESSSLASADYAQFSRGAQTCTHIQDVQSGVTTDLTLSPISLSSGSAAVRIDGSVGGTQVTEYIGATLIKPNVLLIAGYGEVNSGSSQAAYALFQQAVSKAKSHLGGSAASAAPSI